MHKTRDFKKALISKTYPKETNQSAISRNETKGGGRPGRRKGKNRTTVQFLTRVCHQTNGNIFSSYTVSFGVGS